MLNTKIVKPVNPNAAANAYFKDIALGGRFNFNGELYIKLNRDEGKGVNDRNPMVFCEYDAVEKLV